MRDEGKLMLAKRKFDAIVDVVSTSPEVYGTAYRDSAKIKKYWVECGYLDADSYSCPDVIKIMSSSKVHWNPSLRHQFLESLPSLLRKAFKTDDKLGVPVDTDCNGHGYLLSRSTTVLSRRVHF
jgi:hypothetical protein